MTARGTDVDVLIAGGGMVGASLALALVDSGWRIALVEPSGLQVDASPSFDERATALAWSSRRFLSALDVWNDVSVGASAIRHIHVSEQGSFGRSRLHAADLGVDALGHVLPNRLLGEALSERLRGRDNIVLIPAGVATMQSPKNGRVTVRCSDGSSLRSRLVVVADGARSRLRDELGIAARTVSFPHAALVANLEVERPHRSWAYERFTGAGPMALLPLPATSDGRHRMNLVFSLPQAEADHWLQLGDAEILAALRRRFGGHLGEFRGIGERAVYPLFQVRARELVRERVVLAGNAAMAVHPVAGQGFNLALRGVGDLAARLLRLADESGDPGDARMLQAHAHDRRADMRWTGSWTRGLVEAFTLGLPGLGRLRSSALVGLDRCAPARRWFARQAMGRVPGLSSLSRGIPPGGKR